MLKTKKKKTGLREILFVTLKKNLEQLDQYLHINKTESIK